MSVVESLARQLAENRVSARSLVEEALERALDPAGEGARAFVAIDAEGARETADHLDRLRRRGRAPSPYAGIPISVKDLFDLAGEVTRAGSVVLKEAPPATVDALAIARLKSSGFVVLGRTNMTEFAYSGVGLNPHYGTPLCVHDRATGRIPGGSSSGAAISVADEICAVGIGTDTGGSRSSSTRLRRTPSRIPRGGGVSRPTTSSSAMIASAMKQSVTVRASGPTESRVVDSG